MIQSRPRAGLQNAHALASSAAVERAITPRTSDYCWLFCGIGTLPVGPTAVTCKITSADILAAATRKAEVLVEFQGVMALIGQLRLRFVWWTTLTEEPKAKELMRPSLEELKNIEE